MKYVVEHGDAAEILAKHKEGKPLNEAFDEVEGEGAFEALVKAIFGEIQAEYAAEIAAAGEEK